MPKTEGLTFPIIFQFRTAIPRPWAEVNKIKSRNYSTAENRPILRLKLLPLLY